MESQEGTEKQEFTASPTENPSLGHFLHRVTEGQEEADPSDLVENGKDKTAAPQWNAFNESKTSGAAEVAGTEAVDSVVEDAETPGSAIEKHQSVQELSEDDDDDEDDEDTNDGDDYGGNEGGNSMPSTALGGTGSIVGDVLYSIATGEEEGRSRQRILSFAAKRHQAAVERNPADYDALYNWALVLQESADNSAPDQGDKVKDKLLEEACNKYEAATTLCPTLHEAFYNWAIAVSDRAKIRGRTKEAEDLWKQACDKYDRAVQLNWDSPQALNNWGLALQELGLIISAKEKVVVIRKAISKFRGAIRLRFDFHRAIYNLGTVLYGKAEDMLKLGTPTSRTGGKDLTPQELYAQAAVYIAAAHALKVDYPVYRSALRLVRTMLPLPFLKTGYLLVPPARNSLAPHDQWQRKWLVLDHEALQEREKGDKRASTGGSLGSSLAGIPTGGLAGGLAGATGAVEYDENLNVELTRFEIYDVVSVSPCADLSLPRGGGICLETVHGQFYMVAESWDAADGWVDAIRLVYTIHVRAKTEALVGVLSG